MYFLPMLIPLGLNPEAKTRAQCIAKHGTQPVLGCRAMTIHSAKQGDALGIYSSGGGQQQNSAKVKCSLLKAANIPSNRASNSLLNELIKMIDYWAD